MSEPRTLSSLLACLCVAGSAAAANDPQSERLLVPVASPDGAGALRVELLDGATPRLQLDLSTERSLELQFTSRETAWGGGWIWRGRVAGDPLGHATLAVQGEVVCGSVRIGRELWAIESAGRGLHALRQVDEERLPTCAGALPVPGASAGESSESPVLPLQSSQANSPPTIDVLVAYTTEAKDAEGGTSAIQAKINLAIAESNQAYANSQVLQRLRLVHLFETVGYVEPASFSEALGDLRDDNDGLIDNAHTLRDLYGADMVAMIVAGSQYCGIGYLMSPPDAGFEDYAFSVTSRICATGYYTFAHELGHNMGCHHDRDNASSTPAYPYSYGYRTPDSAWRTVMAYSPGTRIQYFSNPNVSYLGQPLGIADPLPLSAENWKSLNNTAPIVAQFRCAIPVVYGTSKTTSAGTAPLLSWSGSPSLASDNLHLVITHALPGKPVIAFYGFTQGSAPWNGGTLYVAGPKIRLQVQTFDAGGSADFTFPTLTSKVGDTAFCQGWFRDPSHPDGTTVGLTNGLRVDFCP